MITPIEARDYVNELIMNCINSEQVEQIMDPLPIPQIYWEGKNVNPELESFVHIVARHSTLSTKSVSLGERHVRYNRVVILELKSPLNEEIGFDKIERLAYLLEGALCLNINNFSEVRIEAPFTDNLGYLEPYNIITLSAKYNFISDLSTRLN